MDDTEFQLETCFAILSPEKSSKIRISPPKNASLNQEEATGFCTQLQELVKTKVANLENTKPAALRVIRKNQVLTLENVKELFQSSKSSQKDQTVVNISEHIPTKRPHYTSSQADRFLAKLEKVIGSHLEPNLANANSVEVEVFRAQINRILIAIADICACLAIDFYDFYTYERNRYMEQIFGSILNKLLLKSGPSAKLDRAVDAQTLTQLLWRALPWWLIARSNEKFSDYLKSESFQSNLFKEIYDSNLENAKVSAKFKQHFVNIMISLQDALAQFTQIDLSAHTCLIEADLVNSKRNPDSVLFLGFLKWAQLRQRYARKYATQALPTEKNDIVENRKAEPWWVWLVRALLALLFLAGVWYILTH